MTRFEQQEHERFGTVVMALFGVLAAFVKRDPLLPAVVVVVGIFLYRAMAKWMLPVAALDEGGVRISGPAGFWRRYVAFSDIAAVELVDATRLVLKAASGRDLFAWRAPSVASASALYADISQRLDARRASLESGFERCGQGLCDWVARLSARFVARGSAYRTRFDPEAALKLLSDLDTPVDTRAGAAFVLLSCADRRGSNGALDAVGPNSPPLVLALASLGPSGAELRGQAKKVLGYLDWRDRAEWTACARGLHEQNDTTPSVALSQGETR